MNDRYFKNLRKIEKVPEWAVKAYERYHVQKDNHFGVKKQEKFWE